MPQAEQAERSRLSAVPLLLAMLPVGLSAQRAVQDREQAQAVPQVLSVVHLDQVRLAMAGLLLSRAVLPHPRTVRAGQ